MTRKQLEVRRQKLAAAVRRVGDLDEVAKEFGVSRQLVRKACREFDVPMRAGQKPRSTSMATSELLADLRNGKSPQDVARHYGISTERITRMQQAAVSGVPSARRRKLAKT